MWKLNLEVDGEVLKEKVVQEVSNNRTGTEDGFRGWVSFKLNRSQVLKRKDLSTWIFKDFQLLDTGPKRSELSVN